MREVECIEGLCGVRTRLEELRDDLTTKIMMRIVTAVVDEPFEKNVSVLTMVWGYGRRKVIE